jgi:tRNA A-37 threonylcarbamoyl transferase component Bud32
MAETPRSATSSTSHPGEGGATPEPSDNTGARKGPLTALRDLVMPRDKSRVSAPAAVSVQVQPFPTGSEGSAAPVAPFAQTMLEGEESSSPPAVAPSLVPGPVTPAERATLWSGRIRAGDEVGRGGMGHVLRGMDTKLRRELALKVTPVSRHQLPMGQLARFVEEAQITAQLEHPNIVPVHDLGLDPDGRAYFSMKLVRGQSLDAILERRRQGDASTLSEFGLRRLLDVFLQICHAVEYAHARGVIHRDLKPANVMVGDFGEVLVMDWGVAKLKGRPERDEAGGTDVSSVRADIGALATQHGAVIGTPAYMSPEQARGANVDERTDVYALGVILYEILCGEVPFDGDEPLQTLTRLLTQPPRPPSQIQPNVPSALEALVLRLLEKEPERRSLGVPQARSIVQDYIEGIGHTYRRESLWTNVLWIVGALGLFAFLVWYLTGQSVATVVALTPSAVFNSVGWLLVVMALGYPLWGAVTNVRVGRGERDRFLAPSSVEIFVSGYLAQRTCSASIAPLFQLVFVVEIFATAMTHASGGLLRSRELVPRIVAQLRAEWAHALIVILVFLFAYLFLLSTEVRFARRIGRYVPLVRRPAWESVWPFFLILFVLATVVTTDIFDWLATGQSYDPRALARDLVLQRPLNVFEIVKTLVFQGTFLLGLVVATAFLAFPFAELLASFRVAYQPADEASVASRKDYFLRSLAVFEIVKANWLYGGAMIGSLTAVSILSETDRRPLVEQVLYILGPALIGFFGFGLARRYARTNLAEAPAVRRMLREQVELAKVEHARAKREELGTVRWQTQLLQVAVPIVCIVGYLLWNGSGVHQGAIRQLIVPVSAKGWLLILPYVLLVPLLLVRDPLQLRRLRRDR